MISQQRSDSSSPPDTIRDEQVTWQSWESGVPGAGYRHLLSSRRPKLLQGQDGRGSAKTGRGGSDLSACFYANKETGQTIIAGMGELHLEIIVDRLLREFHVEANAEFAGSAAEETFTKAVDVDSKCKTVWWSWSVRSL